MKQGRNSEKKIMVEGGWIFENVSMTWEAPWEVFHQIFTCERGHFHFLLDPPMTSCHTGALQWTAIVNPIGKAAFRSFMYSHGHLFNIYSYGWHRAWPSVSRKSVGLRWCIARTVFLAANTERLLITLLAFVSDSGGKREVWTGGQQDHIGPEFTISMYIGWDRRWSCSQCRRYTTVHVRCIIQLLLTKC